MEIRRNLSFNSESGYSSETENIPTRHESLTLDMRVLRRLIFKELSKAMTTSDMVLDTVNNTKLWQKLILNQLGKNIEGNLRCPAKGAKNEVTSSFKRQLQKLVLNQLCACIQ